MQNHIWAKTILTSYRFLERIAGAIDKIIEKKALSSSYMMGSDILTNNTLALTDKIIELSQRKVKLINIKVLVEKALKNMDKTAALLLIKKYFEKQPVEEIMQQFPLPRRTYFRKIGEAESAFEAQCALLKFDNKKLNEYLKDEGWICEIKQSFEKGEEKDFHVKSSSLNS